MRIEDSAGLIAEDSLIWISAEHTRALAPVSNHHRDVPDLVSAVGVAVRVDDLIERVTAPDHGPQTASVDQLPKEDKVRLRGDRGTGDEPCPSAEMDQATRHQGAGDRCGST